MFDWPEIGQEPRNGAVNGLEPENDGNFACKMLDTKGCRMCKAVMALEWGELTQPAKGGPGYGCDVVEEDGLNQENLTVIERIQGSSNGRLNFLTLSLPLLIICNFMSKLKGNQTESICFWVHISYGKKLFILYDY